jgi:hypothetical protein
MARGYRARTPSSRTMNSISCVRSVKALPHDSTLLHANTNGETADSTQGEDHGAGTNIPGKSIPQWYAYRLFVKANRKGYFGLSVFARKTNADILQWFLANAYLKRKQRAKLLSRSIPNLSCKKLGRRTILYGISRRMGVTRAWNQQGSFGASECGEAPRSNVKVDARLRGMFGQVHTTTRASTLPLSVPATGGADEWERWPSTEARPTTGQFRLGGSSKRGRGLRGRRPCDSALSD